MKKNIDVFVLSVMIIFTFVSLIIVSIEPLIENPILINILYLLKDLGGIIIIIKFTKDSNYRFGYFLSAFFSIIFLRVLIFIGINNYFNNLNLYWIMLIKGSINAILWSYFYQLFKEYSYKRMKEEKLFKHEK